MNSNTLHALNKELQRLIGLDMLERSNQGINATTQQLAFLRKKIMSGQINGMEKFICDIAGPKSNLLKILDNDE